MDMDSNYKVVSYLQLQDDPVKKAICMADFSSMNTNCIPPVICANLMQTQGWTVCLDDILKAGVQNCLVYSFGITDEWGFDKDMGALGCEVHSFDPTVSLPEHLAPNVTFHKWGLFGGSRNDSAAMNFKNDKYGKIDGEMYHLGEIIFKLGHQGKNLSVFKIDCEGCEWEVFGYMHAGSWTQAVSSGPRHHHHGPMDVIQQLLVEVHFSEPFLTTDEQLILVGRTFDTIFSDRFHDQPFARFYVHNNPGGVGRRGWYHDNLTAGGFFTSSCCREMGLLRRPTGYKMDVSEVIQVRNVTDQAVFRGDDSKTVYLYTEGKKRMFQSGSAFTRMGYSFDSVKVLPGGEVGLIPDGPDIS